MIDRLRDRLSAKSAFQSEAYFVVEKKIIEFLETPVEEHDINLFEDVYVELALELMNQIHLE